MGTLKARVTDTMKTAMKAGDKERVTFARNLHAAIRKKEVDDRVDVDDAGVEKIASSLIKQRRDSIEQFKKGGRDDLVAKEEAELNFLMEFLPKQLGDDELVQLVEAAIKETGAAGPKEMGKVMKALMPKTQGRADGKKVSQLVKDRLQ